MKAIILAAGYATRLYPLTKDCPKALLRIREKLIIEFIIERLKTIKGLDEIIIASNDKFYSLFIDWLKNYNSGISTRVINDLTTSEDDRLGAMGDLDFVIQKAKIDEDILVIAGDNLFDFGLDDFVQFCHNKPYLSVGIYDIKDLGAASKFGVVNMENNLIVKFAEKPEIPFSSLIAVGIYFFPKKALRFINEYLSPVRNKVSNGMSLSNSRDALGHFIEWLLYKDKVPGYRFEGRWYDIGDIETYERANRSFREK